MPLNGSLTTLQRGTTAQLWKSLQLTFGRTLLKFLYPSKETLTTYAGKKYTPMQMKGRSTRSRSPAVLLLTSKRSWMCSDAHRLACQKNTVLGSIFPQQTSKEPSSTEPASKEPSSGEPTSKEPSSGEPTSKEPTSGEPTSK